jgi:hypothetical protein
MLSTDREEFLALLGKLCAGYDRPCTKAREEAYWSGLGKMSLLQFARAVDVALGEEGPEKFPTPHTLWELHKQAHATHTVHVQTPTDDRDHLEYFANRLLFIHSSNRGGLGSTGRFVPAYGMVDCVASPELIAVLKVKRELVEEFLEYIREGDELATPKEFVRRWVIAIERIGVVTRKTLEHYRVMVSSTDAQQPFPASMARSLKPRQEFIPLAQRA